ncbi:(d)CMP kinase [Gulosibacter macacae]|uniref:Cytidylate kinase n=1 Tax=Gulosibacter macacae TaxID=2488791 RepID=A0A3P3VVK0_9MICO|nr:(d)CMP kinase [Gulosibacter macacae]RRJ85656.1 (d)CMP kinase [Gulosibacter macacae]
MTDASRNIVVAIDGPSGSGKSTVARAAATDLGWHLLDTGSVYRALTWFAGRRGVDTADQDAVVALLPDFFRGWELSVLPEERWVRVDGVDVTDAIRTTEISSLVSNVATNLAVRKAVNERFRELLFGDDAPGIIAEGRDITTVVAPDAPVRILLTADESARIRRRLAEKAGDDAAAVAASVAERDARDSTVVTFTTAADGVVTLDTTELDLDQSIAAVIDLIREHGISRKGSAE